FPAFRLPLATEHKAHRRRSHPKYMRAIFHLEISGRRTHRQAKTKAVSPIARPSVDEARYPIAFSARVSSTTEIDRPASIGLRRPFPIPAFLAGRRRSRAAGIFPACPPG